MIASAHHFHTAYEFNSFLNVREKLYVDPMERMIAD